MVTDHAGHLGHIPSFIACVTN